MAAACTCGSCLPTHGCTTRVCTIVSPFCFMQVLAVGGSKQRRRRVHTAVLCQYKNRTGTLDLVRSCWTEPEGC
jgi:hypothetical protein